MHISRRVNVSETLLNWSKEISLNTEPICFQKEEYRCGLLNFIIQFSCKYNPSLIAEDIMLDGSIQEKMKWEFNKRKLFQQKTPVLYYI